MCRLVVMLLKSDGDFLRIIKLAQAVFTTFLQNWTGIHLLV